jgi:acyl carrier protein
MRHDTTVSEGTARPTPDVAAAVRAILAPYNKCSPDQISLDDRLEHDIQLDSLAMIEITVALEQACGVSMGDAVDPKDLNLVTVGDLVVYVSRLVDAQRPPSPRSGPAGPAERYE